MNATPRPWHYEDHVIRSVTGQNVSGLVPRRMSAGDLQLILTAVNSYDAMREALEAIQKFSWTLPHAYREADVWKQVDTALSNPQEVPQ